MKIMIVADVHIRTKVEPARRARTMEALKKAFSCVPCDLAIFLGDLMHGPDYGDDKERFLSDLKEALDATGDVPFAFVFGNHDAESAVTKDEILHVLGTYDNSLTQGENYVLHPDGEMLLFIDSGSEYDGEESHYDIVRPAVIDWAKQQIAGKQAILFQHIIVPDIMDVVEADGEGNWQFKDGFAYTGKLNERPCPPDINTGELEILAPHLKAMAFGHDHVNSFECDLHGVKIIQCAAASVSGYEYPQEPTVRLLDTKTMTSEIIPV